MFVWWKTYAGFCSHLAPDLLAARGPWGGEPGQRGVQALCLRDPRLHLHLPLQRGDPAHHRYILRLRWRERRQVNYISGYGSRGSTNECWDTVVLQCIQSIVGVIIQVLDNLPTNFARIDDASGKLRQGLNGVRNLSRNGLVTLHLVLRAHSVVAAQ